MIRKIQATFLATFFVATSAALASPEIGAPAPDFTLTSSVGNEHSLSDFKGKFVVLEWINYDCPFVVKHYTNGDMQALQTKYRDQDVVWLSISSSKPGSQGHFDADGINARMEKEKANPTAYLIDEPGEVGKAYGARTTPHMFIIDPEGNLIYKGGIDDNRSANPDDVKTANNFVVEALTAAMAGEAVPNPVTQEYGCSVKY